MFKGQPIIPQIPGNGVVMGPSRRPKGLGRRTPHSGRFTRKTCQTFDHSIAISDGLDKISLFFTGKQIKRKPVISKTNPFKKLMDKLLKFVK